MNRKTFFRNLAALGVAVGIAPKVIAEEKAITIKVPKESGYKMFTLGVEKGRPDRPFEFRSISVKNIGGKYVIRVAGPHLPATVGSMIVDERSNCFWVQATVRKPEYSEAIVLKLSSRSLAFPRPGLFVVCGQTMAEG